MTNAELYILLPIVILMLIAFVIVQVSKYKQNNQVATKFTKPMKNKKEGYKSYFSKKGNAEGYDYMGNHMSNIIVAVVVMLLVFLFIK